MSEAGSTRSHDHPSLKILRSIAEHLKQIRFPRLTRPRVLPHERPTQELVAWGIQAYCFPWILHLRALIGGIVTLHDSGNRAAVRIVGRSSFELCAHVYYVKKHLKQHLDEKKLAVAWEFLSVISTGSRYINELYPEDSKLFPAGAHIGKVVNCFKEVMPKESQDDYSYLSEYCHPNMMTFGQHYRWTTPGAIEFMDAVEFGAFGAITASAIQGLLAVHELLGIGNEKEIRRAVAKLLRAIAEQAKDGE